MTPREPHCIHKRLLFKTDMIHSILIITTISTKALAFFFKDPLLYERSKQLHCLE